jgi:hypothetical protein
MPSRVLPSASSQALEVMERSLAQRLAAVTEPPAAPAAEPDRLPAFERLQEGLDRLQSCAERAGQDAAQSDALLATAAADFHAWLGAVGATRQMLANWTGHTV